MQRDAKRFNLFTFILLVLLIVLFYKELLILGVRFYAAITENPQADNLLGNYYQTAARNNVESAEHFYQKALKNYLTQLANTPTDDKAEVNFIIGRYYECAKGTPYDLAKAKNYYHEADKASANSTKKATIGPKIQQALTRVNNGNVNGDPKGALHCQEVADELLIIKSLSFPEEQKDTAVDKSRDTNAVTLPAQPTQPSQVTQPAQSNDTNDTKDTQAVDSKP